MTAFADLGRYKRPWIDTPPAADILAAVRRGQSYGELAAIYGVSESTLRRRVSDSGLVKPRRHGGLAPSVPGDEPTWMAEAPCAQTDPEAFFPEIGGTSRDGKRICGACEFRDKCLAYALDNDERFGIWGGMTPNERRKLKKENR